MPTYVRNVKGTAWARLQDGDASHEAVEQAVEDLLSFGDPSVFEANDCRDLEIIALARMAKRSAAKFEFLVIPPEQLTTLGIRTDKTDGDTLIPYANDRHYELRAGRAELRRLVLDLSRPRPCILMIKPKMLKELAHKHTDIIEALQPDHWFFKP